MNIPRNQRLVILVILITLKVVTINLHCCSTIGTCFIPLSIKHVDIFYFSLAREFHTLKGWKNLLNYYIKEYHIRPINLFYTIKSYCSKNNNSCNIFLLEMLSSCGCAAMLCSCTVNSIGGIGILILYSNSQSYPYYNKVLFFIQYSICKIKKGYTNLCRYSSIFFISRDI